MYNSNYSYYKIIRLILQPLTFHYITARLDIYDSNYLGCYPGAIFWVTIIRGYISVVNYSAGQ